MNNLKIGFLFFFLSLSEGHIGLERKVTKLEAMVKMLQEDLKKVGDKMQTYNLHVFWRHMCSTYSHAYLCMCSSTFPCCEREHLSTVPFLLYCMLC